MKKSKSSAKWLQEHNSDKFVKQSKQDGFYARSSYKLLEIEDKYKVFAGKSQVVDLGAAPGGWSQVTRKLLPKAQIFALDLLPIKPVADVIMIKGDFTDNTVLKELESHLKNTGVDLILSDMAPNFSGHKAVDIPKAMYLVELGLDFAYQMLAKHGDLVCKVFQGPGFDELVQNTRQIFNKVNIFKPESSRDRSKEVYLVCQDKTTEAHYNGL